MFIILIQSKPRREARDGKTRKGLNKKKYLEPMMGWEAHIDRDRMS